MTNADKFKNIFGLYATELWSMPEKDFLKWLNSEAMNCSEFPNNSDTISRQAAIEAIQQTIIKEYDRNYGVIDSDIVYEILDDLPAADVVPYSIEPDGTMTITVPKGTKRIGRILIEEDGTQYGGLFYPDTGGCFLSSLEKE